MKVVEATTILLTDAILDVDWSTQRSVPPGRMPLPLCPKWWPINNALLIFDAIDVSGNGGENKNNAKSTKKYLPDSYLNILNGMRSRSASMMPRKRHIFLVLVLIIEIMVQA